MNISYTNEITDAYQGQINCEAGIYLNDEIIGLAQYVLYNGELTISNIFIRPEFRRKGFGSRLIKYIKFKNPEFIYKPSLKTTDGSSFIHKDLSLEENYKFVCESVEDILKPRSKKEIDDELKKIIDFSNIKLTIDYLPSLRFFLKSFVLEKTMYDKKNDNYIHTNLTKEAVEMIMKCCRYLNFSKFDELKVLEIHGGNKQTELNKLMYLMNTMNGSSIKKLSNKVFDYIYEGNNYAFIGSYDGFHLFFITPNFLNMFK